MAFLSRASRAVGMVVGFFVLFELTVDAQQDGNVLSPITVSSPAPTVTYAPCVIPTDLNDVAFGRHVDLLLLGTAWDNQDAALLTDVGLQLAEGERILMRPHKALTSEQVLEFAAHLAGGRRDKATLTRLKKVAESRKNAKLADLVTRETVQAETVDNHPLGHAIEDISPAALEMHKSAIRKIRAARLAGNRRDLDSLDRYFDQQKVLHKSQQEHIDKEIAEAKGNLPKEADFSGLIAILDRLAALMPCQN